MAYGSDKCCVAVGALVLLDLITNKETRLVNKLNCGKQCKWIYDVCFMNKCEWFSWAELTVESISSNVLYVFFVGSFFLWVKSLSKFCLNFKMNTISPILMITLVVSCVHGANVHDQSVNIIFVFFSSKIWL